MPRPWSEAQTQPNVYQFHPWGSPLTVLSPLLCHTRLFSDSWTLMRKAVPNAFLTMWCHIPEDWKLEFQHCYNVLYICTCVCVLRN